MTSTEPLPPPPGPSGPAAPRRATRDSQHLVLGGVASGLAQHLGLPVTWVRVAFVATTALGGLGAAMYAAMWLFLPSDARFETAAPGLEGATRTGRRPGRAARLSDAGPAIALGALGLGVLLGLQAFVGATGLLWPLVLAGVGVALLWRQADEAQRERWLNPAGGVGPLRAVFGTGTWSSYLRVAAGVVLVAAAATLAAVNDEGLSVARDVAFSALLGIAGVAVVIGPWVFRLASDLGAERAERIRTQERADVAAHLHDSVLQTLALIQRNAGDPETVSRLARAQERELRTWLYVGEEGTDETVAGALREAAARVEDEHGAVVDVVTVGDTVAGPGLRALALAAKEAMVNAAKHAGTARVDVYAETGPESVEVFVRDRGVGFDLDAVPQDRLGVRGSIMDRMARHGGTATVRSAPGEGTEVRLWMPLEEG
ncbi:ATP-binding protein [Nocardioides campestrisoli]|uniref:ATP-binding protein n=1 Tax=Nocardioides campestrisoli TaxID=2736757 RepID=UPI00163DB612|nr:ATP-binding protein [Nocardioides campestrisoli]